MSPTIYHPDFQHHSITDLESDWRQFAEDLLISVYVPEANQMPRAEALELAIKRDAEAARNLYSDLNLEKAAAKAKDPVEEQILANLGFY